MSDASLPCARSCPPFQIADQAGRVLEQLRERLDEASNAPGLEAMAADLSLVTFLIQKLLRQ